MKYKYEAFNSKGNIMRGTIEASSENEIRQRLKRKGLVVSRIEAETGTKKKRRGKIKKEDLIMFTRQAAVMVGAGIGVTRALFTLADQIENQAFATVIREVGEGIESGLSFTDSLKRFPKVFPQVYISTVEAGELGGELQKSLERIAEQLTKEKQIHDNIKSAMMYPIIIFCFAVVVTLAMLLFLIPVFKGLFPPGMQLPIVSKLVIMASDSLRSRWYLWLLVVIGLAFGFRQLLKTPAVINAYENIKFKIPIAGNLIHKMVLARFARTLSTLVDSGVGIIDALQNTGPTVGSLLIDQACRSASEAVKDGETIAKALQSSGLFPAMVIQMISIGEETGQVADLLDKVAKFYEEEVAVMAKGLTSLLEPVMLIFIGGIVGGLLIAMYLPIFTAVASQSG